MKRLMGSLMVISLLFMAETLRELVVALSLDFSNFSRNMKRAGIA